MRAEKAHHRYRQPLFGVLLTVLVILFISQNLDMNSLLAQLVNIDPVWMAIGLLLFFLNYALRAHRFRLLSYSSTPSPLNTFGVSALHGMFNYLLPAKLGELAYPLLARSHLGLTTSEGTATLIVARFWDFAIIALLLPFVATFFTGGLPSWALFSTLGFSGLIIMALAGIFWLASRPPSAFSEGGRIKTELGRLAAGLRNAHNQGNHTQLALLSVGIWLCIYGNFYCLVRALGVDTTLFEMAVASTLLLPITLLPIQGLANIGTHELAWVTTLRLFGHDMETSLQIAVGTHFLLLLFVLILGISGLICLHLARRR
ncbi:MAG TPA: flippase-like domain-containing protein [Gammaproteobacteria bacterium]|nr:flippase-like domain-containing protein [Gammaproteobacteria bacterium]